MKSILQDKKECLVCGAIYPLHLHHCIHGVANRKKSDEDGLVVWLCYEHHNGSSMGVHFNKYLDMKVKQYAQKRWEEEYGGEDEEQARINFIKRYGKSYL